MSTAPVQLIEPCSRVYLHHPHLIQVVGLSNTVQDLICPGTEVKDRPPTPPRPAPMPNPVIPSS